MSTEFYSEALSPDKQQKLLSLAESLLEEARNNAKSIVTGEANIEQVAVLIVLENLFELTGADLFDPTR